MGFIAAASAHADKKDGPGPAKGCLIEKDGKLETVPVGSIFGGFECGSDGEWRSGWFIEWISHPPHKPLPPVGTGAISHGVLQAAKA